MSLATGAKLGRYEILAAIGAGGMGEVWKARDTDLDRLVAVKTLPPRLASDPDALARFEREARALAALNHPAILSILDVGRSEGVAYAVLELLEGETLRERIARGGVSLRKALEIGIQIARGLSAAHEKGIVHRDLKPENLWLTRDGSIKILDFGLAKVDARPLLDAASTIVTPVTGGTPASAPGTAAGTVLGTVGYMSPEQVRGIPTDARSDLFSFGVVLWELVAGEQPFRGPSSVETLHAILTKDPPEIRSEKGVPPGVLRVLDHCLQKAPEARFQSARDLAFALEALSSASGLGSRAPLPKPYRRRRGAWAAATALAAAVLGAGLWLRVSARVAPPLYRRLTYRDGAVRAARFSRDGQTILFSASWTGGPPQLYLTRPGGTEARPLDPPYADLLAVSRNDDLLILRRPVRSASNIHIVTGELARTNLAGGAPLALADRVVAADWAPDGRGIVAIRRVSEGFRIEFPLGTPILEEKSRLGGLRVSPDGRSLAFLRFREPAASNAELAVMDVATRKARTVTAGFVSLGGLAWTRDGREIRFSAYADSRGSVLSADLAGRVRTVASLPDDTRIEDVSADGRVLLVNGTIGNGSLGQRTPESPVFELCPYKWGYTEAMSEDGARAVVFADPLDGDLVPHLYLRDLEGSEPTALHVESSDPTAALDAGILMLAESAKPPILSVSPPGATGGTRLEVPGFERVTPLAALDGAVLLAGSLPAGPLRLVRQPLAGGPPEVLLDLEGVEPSDLAYGRPLVSPDRGTIVAGTPASGFRRAELRRGARFVPIDGLLHEEAVAQWTQDGKALYVFRPGPPPLEVSILDVASGKRRPFRRLEFPEHRDAFFVRLLLSRDGRSLSAVYSRSSLNLYLVDGLR